MKLIIVTYLTALALISFTMQSSAAPAAPALAHSVNGLTITINWTSVPGATNYKLSYAPMPYTGAETIGSLDVGGQTSFSATLWEGAAFHIAVQAGDGLGFSEYSNIDSFNIAASPVNLTGNWSISETEGPNNCGENQNIKWDSTVTIDQTGTSLTVKHYIGSLFSRLDETVGNIVGNTVNLSTVKNNGSDDMYVATLSVVSEDEISGSVSYTTIDEEGEGPCSGTGSITGHRIK